MLRKSKKARGRERICSHTSPHFKEYIYFKGKGVNTTTGKGGYYGISGVTKASVTGVRYKYE
jgi:hypothetical protein